MDNALYIALSRQVGLMRQMDVVANNVANVNSAGFKAEQTIFQQYLMNDVPGKIAFGNDVATARDLSQGALTHTGRPLDAAIEGSGYFAVMTPLGKRYTRAGSFTINSDNELSTASGYPVLDDGGQPIIMDENDSQFMILEDGTIVTGNNEERGRIGVYAFDNEYAMRHLGNSLYDADEAPVVSENYRLAQGFVESSNVNSVTMLTELIKVSRDAASAARIVQDMRDMQSQAVSTLLGQAK
ncbi:MAG: flagellar basal-body rod protein FlgF [Hyphomicrobiales bacterium]|nr:flagellar basal-body rod protein FlgF [Rickettsiales bacterium]MCP5361658.1 flagellar basal-body rod protein FlgF [Hyphomicrobiales bacterium]